MPLHRDGQYPDICIGDSFAKYFFIAISTELSLPKSIEDRYRFILISCIADANSMGDTFNLIVATTT